MKGRTVVLAVVVVGLLATVVAANLAVGADRTVLDEEFVGSQLDEGDGYATITAEVEREIERNQASDFRSADRPYADTSTDRILSRAITEEYVRTQIDSNLERIFAYLHGDSDDLELIVDTRPLKAEVAAEVEAEAQTVNLAEVDPTAAEMAETQEQYEATQVEFRQVQKSRIQRETDRDLDQSELEAEFDRQRSEIRAELLAEAAEEAEAMDAPGPVQEAAVEVAAVRIDALLDEDTTHEEYVRDLEEAREEFGIAVGEATRSQLDDELPDRFDVTDEMDASDRAAVEEARSVVSLVGLLATLLPIAALALALVARWLTPARSTWLVSIGAPVGIAGIVGVVGAALLSAEVTDAIDEMVVSEGVGPGLAELLLTISTATIETVTSQSWLLTGIGLGLVAAGVALRAGAFPLEDRPGESSTGAVGAGKSATAEDSSDAEADASDDDERPAEESDEEESDADEEETDDDVSGEDAGDAASGSVGDTDESNGQETAGGQAGGAAAAAVGTASSETDEDSILEALQTGIASASDLRKIEASGPLVSYTAAYEDVDARRVRILTPAADDPDDETGREFRNAVGKWGKVSQYDEVVTVHEFGDRPRPWVVTERVRDGRRLSDVVSEDGDLETQLAPVIDAAAALRQAGRYTVRHYSLDPDVVWVRTDGSDVSGRLDDWGLAAAIGDGTPETTYTAPELRPDSEYSPWQSSPDVYGLGALAQFAITGTAPSDSVDRVDSGIPGPVREPVERALESDPDERQSSPGEFGTALRVALESL